MSTSAREAALPFQHDFSAAELSARRRKLLAELREGLVVLAAAPEIPGFDPVRQDNDFYYLTGVETPHAYLTLDASTGRGVLYLPPRAEKHEKTDGPTLSDEDGEFILARTDIDEVRPVSRLVADLSNREGVLWLARAPAENVRQCQDTLRHYHRRILGDPLDGRLSRETHLLARLAQLSPRASFQDFSPIIHRHRLVKSPAELALMRHAGRLTALACLEAIKASRAGVFEYQLGAVADYVFLAAGARCAGYRPIIATGANIWMMHYWRNDTALRDGELVLFDYAPDYRYYTSDIGRMWPVNGVYSAQQRELYGFVLEHHRVLLSLIRPHVTKAQILEEAAAQLRPVVEARVWSKPIYREAALRLLASPRPLSHGVGMPVHESACWYDRPLEPGLVFALDPELVVPEEQIYIRVEDTVAVTTDGCENLTADCPREMDEVEALLRETRAGSGGLLQQLPPITPTSPRDSD
jgi:Xaa-Pro aminopeptidase